MAAQLPRSRPSDQNVDAGGLLDFLAAIGHAGIDLHSLMVVRHGAVVAEGWFSPYTEGQIQLLYSLSKSFTSTAVGIAQEQGLFSVDDLVLDHFPDDAPANPNPFLRAMRVRDLLAMASGHQEDTWQRVMASGDTNLVRAFLALPPENAPGTHFAYNQGCTHTLAALVCRRTGLSLIDYLRPRLLDPLGDDGVFWRKAADGVEEGYSGLHATTETIAKLGQLYLQKGLWEGQQLVPEAYVAAATQVQVDNSRFGENIDWQQGYGFQFWRCRNDAFRGDGAFGQFCVVIPNADAVIALTSQTTEMQAELDLVWQHILPALSGPGDESADRRLEHHLKELSTDIVVPRSAGPKRPIVFEPEGETPGFRRLHVAPAEPCPHLTLTHEGGELSVELRPRRWARAELEGVRELLPPVAVSGGWLSEREFEADLVFLTGPHRLRLRAVDDTYTATWVQPPL